MDYRCLNTTAVLITCWLVVMVGCQQQVQENDDQNLKLIHRLEQSLFSQPKRSLYNLINYIFDDPPAETGDPSDFVAVRGRRFGLYGHLDNNRWPDGFIGTRLKNAAQPLRRNVVGGGKSHRGPVGPYKEGFLGVRG